MLQTRTACKQGMLKERLTGHERFSRRGGDLVMTANELQDHPADPFLYAECRVLYAV